MVRPDSDLTVASLAERIEALESGYSAVAHVASPAGSSVASDTVGTVSTSSASDGGSPAEVGRARGGILARAVRTDRTGAESAPASEPSTPTAECGPLSQQTRSVLANPASLQRLWQSVLSDVKKQKAAYGVLFMNTKATFDSDRDMVLIQFGAEAGFAYGAVQKPEVREAVDEVVCQECGRVRSLRLCSGGRGSGVHGRFRFRGRPGSIDGYHGCGREGRSEFGRRTGSGGARGRFRL